MIDNGDLIINEELETDMKEELVIEPLVPTETVEKVLIESLPIQIPKQIPKLKYYEKSTPIEIPKKKRIMRIDRSLIPNDIRIFSNKLKNEI